MRLYHDLDYGYFTATRGSTSPLRRLDLKVGDGITIEIEFLRSGVAYVPATAAELIFVIKSSYAEDAPALAVITTGDWDVDAGIYSAALDTNTEELRDAIGSAGNVTLKAELTATLDGTGPSTTATVPCRVENDLWKGDEATPLSLPTPLEWLASQTLTRTAAQGSPNAVLSITVSGELTSDGSTPVVFPELLANGFSGGRPLYESTDGNFTLESDGAGTQWNLNQVSPLAQWIATDSSAYPTDDLVFTPSASATGVPALAVTGQLTATFLGQRCIVGSVNPVEYTWDGTEWYLSAPTGVIEDRNNPGQYLRTFINSDLAHDFETYTPADS